MRRVAWVAAAGFLLVLASVWLFGRPAWRDWQYRRAVTGAEAHLQQDRLREASLLARHALALQPAGEEALRLAVALATRLGGPEVLIWQQQLCDARPGDVAEHFNLARKALAFRETMVADLALARVPPPARQSSAWQELAAGIAGQQGQLAQAEKHLRQALALSPERADLQLDLASVRLLSTDPAIAAAARAETERLAERPDCRLNALRNLLADARRRGHGERARTIAARLAQLPEATAADRLAQLEELKKADQPRFRVLLGKLREGAADSPPTIAGLIEWMNANDLAEESARWFVRLPVEIRTVRPIAPAGAEALAAAGDWSALKALTASGDWGAIEFMRHAFRSRAEAGLSGSLRSSPSIAAWDQAIAATRANYSALVLLARLTQSWKWDDRAAQVWWLVASQPSGQRRALTALFAHYRAAGDTAQLYEVSRRAREVDPLDPIAKNNCAALALLLGRDLAEAHQLAAEMHAAFPKLPAITSTHAFSLTLQGKPAEALKLFDAMPPADLADPSVAFYRAVALANLGQLDEARPTLTAALERRDVLPEEKKLAAHLLGRE